MNERRLKFWGWGWEGESATDAEVDHLKRTYGAALKVGSFPDIPPPAEDEFKLPIPRLSPPDSLAAICSGDPYTRLVHCMGKSLPDAVRMFNRQAPHVPDIVAFPESEEQVSALMDWAGDAGAALIPFGGGSSVVGGVEPIVDDAYK
ncbi:MAG: FAD-binding protein, partial [Rhodospirillaceae bacterium]|nr:FAD-binding protein [Rhodospirillaceae bacterium]